MECNLSGTFLLRLLYVLLMQGTFCRRFKDVFGRICATRGENFCNFPPNLILPNIYMNLIYSISLRRVSFLAFDS